MAPLNTYNEQQKESARMRGKAIDRLRENGLAWNTIAEALGITRQRAQQLHAKWHKPAKRNGKTA